MQVRQSQRCRCGCLFFLFIQLRIFTFRPLSAVSGTSITPFLKTSFYFFEKIYKKTTLEKKIGGNFDKSTKYIKNFHILAQNVLTFLVNYAIIKVEDERRTLNFVLL